MVWRNDQVSERETARILEVARGCLGVSGDFVEMGCYRGDTSILLAEVLRDGRQRGNKKNGGGGDFGISVEECEKKRCDGEDRENARLRTGEEGQKRLWIYDSFEGLPEKSAEDDSAIGENFKRGVLAVSKREVKRRFLRGGLRLPKIVKGWFADLDPGDLPEEIAFAFLDGDLYESIRDCLRLVGPRMAVGGAILVHDYRNEALPGVAKAVDEYLEEGVWGETRAREAEIEVVESLAIIRKN